VPQVFPSIRQTLVFAALLVIGAGIAFRGLPVAAEGARAIPPPVLDEPGAATSEVAVLAGGCFWGVQGVFQHVEGVASATSGYTGGAKSTSQYERLSSGTTGHAESVPIVFDPHRISSGRILQVFFSVAHDPTELNRQGPDVGSQYRSAIFPENAEQADVAAAYIAQFDRARVFPDAIVTKVETGRQFFRAEAYHQDYLTLHPNDPCIATNDLPKIAQRQHLFPNLYRASPVLVAASGPVN
jgi:peptide-methionine (S)-S-oxide reductase